ncbi:uncharacterized protein MYCFIDRAFT_174788 [Pseudocercospora fijiensis CIRAD86]|uniref:Uncharacterized protein n=1 Tax=Pseudocercospora fijiensis (strain CIRAD86) TaxID=383855 RepID=M3B1P2_PSEFD|nr:uncharacterized protein MYCFIDRAFT_174788 [Pseudocercospora fijiensis CIRAD86]EME83332.1 hypothetical protein MYCFIDRAFT_174788 [Pseudocercospora fijiensis CIRAD86]
MKLSFNIRDSIWLNHSRCRPLPLETMATSVEESDSVQLQSLPVQRHERINSKSSTVGRQAAEAETQYPTGAKFCLTFHYGPLPQHCGCRMALSGLQAMLFVFSVLLGKLYELFSAKRVFSALISHSSRWCNDTASSVYLLFRLGPQLALVHLDQPSAGERRAHCNLLLPDRRLNQTKQRNLLRRDILGQLDLVGNVVFVPALAWLFIALSFGGVSHEWSYVKIAMSLVAFVVLLGIFVKQESATSPHRIIVNRNMLAGFLFSSCTNSVNSIIEVHGFDLSTCGLLMAPILVGFTVSMLITGSGTTIFSYYTPFMVAASVLSRHRSRAADIVLWLCRLRYGDADDIPGQWCAISSVRNAQTILTESQLAQSAPDLDVDAIESMRFSDLQSSLGPDKLAKMVHGSDVLLSQTYYLPVGLVCITIIGPLLMDWRSVKHTQC